MKSIINFLHTSWIQSKIDPANSWIYNAGLLLAGIIALSCALVLFCAALFVDDLVSAAILLASATCLFMQFGRAISAFCSPFHDENSTYFLIICRCALILGVCLLMRHFYLELQVELFDAVAKAISDEPGTVIVAMVTGMFTLEVCKLFCPTRARSLPGTPVSNGARTSLVPFEKAGPRTELSDWDAKLIAAHEAGHAVVAGLFPRLAKDAEVVLQMGHDNPNYLDGYCRINGWSNKTQSMGFYEIRMLIALAGLEAELLCFGDRTVSASSDHDRFVELATHRLKCDDQTIYFTDPANEFEAKHNSEALLKIKNQYQATVRALLIENRSILDAIRASLLDKGFVKAAELEELLGDFKAVPGCPVLSGPLREAFIADTEAADK